jgi:putative restriction endonuclease
LKSAFRNPRSEIVRLYVGITDYDWFKLHAANPAVEEVNFWKPSSQLGFKVLQWGEPFLFKIKGRRFIGGGGFFTKFLQLPLSLAWDAFGEANGAKSLAQLRMMIAQSRHRPIAPNEDPKIGCTLLEEPFFFEEKDWIPLPDDFRQGIQMGKSYDMGSGTGLRLWWEVTARLEAEVRASEAVARPLGRAASGPATTGAIESARFGQPRLVAPRLGQGSFRVLITDAYRSRCAMTSERTLPVLEAAHIRPYAAGGEHALSNGLLLRSDLHKLFDLGYLTVDPKDLAINVSQKIREEYEKTAATTTPSTVSAWRSRRMPLRYLPSRVLTTTRSLSLRVKGERNPPRVMFRPCFANLLHLRLPIIHVALRPTAFLKLSGERLPRDHKH